jgi:replicative DNA helicase
VSELIRAPHSEEAEQSLLGGLMLDRNAWVEVGDVLTPAMFFRPDHQLIYAAIAALADANEVTDQVTVADKLGERLKEAGGLAYLGTLTRDTPGASNVRAYAEIVKERASRRHMIEAGRELVALGTIGFEREELDKAQQLVLDITTEKIDQGFRAVGEQFSAHVDELTARGERKTRLVGPSTGFSAIDQYTQGLEPGTLMLIGAQPSVGKTALACCMLENLSNQAELASAMFSLEMPRVQLLDRFIASECRIPLTDIRSGQLSDEHWVRIAHASRRIQTAAVYIDDTSSITIGEIRARARRLKHKLAREGKKLVAVVVDYLQLVIGIGHNPNERVGSVSSGLKRLAKELDLCVVALSQLSRAVSNRDEKRPTLSDLRDSGSLEQDADVVILLWRAEGINQGVRPGEVAKNRNGATGNFALAFEPKFTRFETIDMNRELDWNREQEEARNPKKKARAQSPEERLDRRAGND